MFDTTSGAFGHPLPSLSDAHLARHNAGDAAFGLTFVATRGQPEAPDSAGCSTIRRAKRVTSATAADARRPPANRSRRCSFARASRVPTRTAVQIRRRCSVDNSSSMRYQGSLPKRRLARPTQTPAAGSATAHDTSFAYRTTFRGLISTLPSHLLTSPRVAQVNFGLGLLEAVPEATIRALADPNDADGDGISGRYNLVYDVPLRDYIIGRFGWKANVGSLMHQAAGAFNGDMGITSAFFPDENCAGEFLGCRSHAAEVSDQTIADVAFYTQTLAVPARRDVNNPVTMRGEQLFHAIGCNGCHVSTLTTGVLPNVPGVSNQRIHPYTDLLLHDMGNGLADNRPDFRASGREWRTPPLWGIGLIQTVNGHTFLLHDGRARNMLEAVLWHDGEGKNARERFKSLSASDRNAMLAFLNSL